MPTTDEDGLQPKSLVSDNCSDPLATLRIALEQLGVELAGEFNIFYHNSLAVSNDAADGV